MAWTYRQSLKGARLLALLTRQTLQLDLILVRRLIFWFGFGLYLLTIGKGMMQWQPQMGFASRLGQMSVQNLGPQLHQVSPFADGKSSKFFSSF